MNDITILGATKKFGDLTAVDKINPRNLFHKYIESSKSQTNNPLDLYSYCFTRGCRIFWSNSFN